MRKIGDAAIRLMRAAGVHSVVWGDGILTEIYSEGTGRRAHPLNAIQRTMNALERDRRFRKTKIRAHDKNGRPRLVRCFWVKDATWKGAGRRMMEDGDA